MWHTDTVSVTVFQYFTKIFKWCFIHIIRYEFHIGNSSLIYFTQVKLFIFDTNQTRVTQILLICHTNPSQASEFSTAAGLSPLITLWIQPHQTLATNYTAQGSHSNLAIKCQVITDKSVAIKKLSLEESN